MKRILIAIATVTFIASCNNEADKKEVNDTAIVPAVPRDVPPVNTGVGTTDTASYDRMPQKISDSMP